MSLLRQNDVMASFWRNNNVIASCAHWESHQKVLQMFHIYIHALNVSKQEIAANYEKYIRARDPFPWRSIHQNLHSLGNSLCSDSNLAGASLCRYNFCTWQVWHETHLPVYRYTVKACAKFVLMTRKWNTTKWNFNHAGMCITVMS